jgi:molybdenum cofactor guanylyltransferase
MNTKISAIILAGGQGRRFNHQDKGLIRWQGQPLISHVINRLKPQVDQVIINCNRNVEFYRGFGYPVQRDELPGFQGPLAGIQSCLALAEHPVSLICPCDTPNLPSDLASRLLTELTAQQFDVAYPVCEGRSHYLPTLIRSNLLASLSNYLNQTDRSMKGWYSTLNTVEVDFSTGNGSFLNINKSELL